MRGNPSAHIGDVRDVEMVMKDGVGTTGALVDSAAGSIGADDYKLLLRWPANAIMTFLLLLLAIFVNRMGRRRAGSTITEIPGISKDSPGTSAKLRAYFLFTC